MKLNILKGLLFFSILGNVYLVNKLYQSHNKLAQQERYFESELDYIKFQCTQLISACNKE
jgi:hypothetical protein